MPPSGRRRRRRHPPRALARHPATSDERHSAAVPNWPAAGPLVHSSLHEPRGPIAHDHDSTEGNVIITCRGVAPANELQVAREVSSILERRAALARPPVSLSVPDAVALGIAESFR